MDIGRGRELGVARNRRDFAECEAGSLGEAVIGHSARELRLKFHHCQRRNGHTRNRDVIKHVLALKYRISAIGWYNFELLVQTLLKGIIGPGVTSFGGSKDGGRDATFRGSAGFPNVGSQWRGSWRFQVKYVDFEEAGAAAARSSLKSTFKQEFKEILGRRLKLPNNYILLTNVPLTATTRDELDEIIRASKFPGNFAAVDGKEICQFLDLYPDVRRAYPQLLGLADLEVIINRDLYVRSQAYVEQWQPRLATFVQTSAHLTASAVIKKEHFVVLDGPPEAGKTTIAAALALSFASEGFEVIDIRESNEVFRAYDPKRPQIFVADDAIGSVSLDPARADDWSRDLPGVLRKMNKKHLLIWTARRYILEEALAESRLGEAVAEFPGVHDVIVEVGALSPIEKAAMLYNHAKQAGLRPEYKKLIRQKAMNIIHDGNFTPERVRQLTEIVLSPSINGRTTRAVTWPDVQKFLDNPSERWIKAYRKLSLSEQALLSAMLDFDGSTPAGDLKVSYESRAVDLGSKRLSFEESVSRLKHSFLRATISYDGEELIAVQHPSLRDMLLLDLRDDPTARRRYLMLASPFGLAGVIGGIALTIDGSSDNRDLEHAVVPKTEEEFEIFLKRLREFSQGVLRLRDWEELLSAAERLIPRKQDPPEPISGEEILGASLAELASGFMRPKRIESSELDLAAFQQTWPGRIIGALLEG
jgi:hypothetical protein